MSALLAVDTSVAVPLVVQTHVAHQLVVEWWGGRSVSLSGHALVETYSVLTRLPGDVRLSPDDAVRIISERFAPPLVLHTTTWAALSEVLAGLGVAGGAVYDGMIALAAAEHEYTLATRDQRARATYELVGVAVELVA